jgi:uncharacterized membrane protein
VGGWSRSKLRQWWWIAFVLGTLMINYPFLHIFNRRTSLFGLPLLFLYFLVGWATSIAVIALYVWALRRAPPEDR